MSEVNKKQRVNITMGEWLLDELDYMAAKRGMSRSAFLSMLVSNEFMKQTREGNINSFEVFSDREER